jgi:hypothetical protein
MNEIRIRAAIEHARNKGGKLTKTSIAVACYPESRKATAIRNLDRMINGTTRRIDPDQVFTICEMTGVDANFLFSTPPMEDSL